MANILAKVAAIRTAIFGKDVRESIASGIEAINDEVENTTGRQNVIDSQEQTRINNENVRKTNETTRQNTFNTNEAARQNTFDNNEAVRSEELNKHINNNEIHVTKAKTDEWDLATLNLSQVINILDKLTINTLDDEAGDYLIDETGDQFIG